MKPKQSPTRRFYIILILILMVVGSCASRRGEFICGSYELTEAEKIKSEITYYKIDSSVDSQFCNVHGVVTMAFKEEDKIVIENLSHTKILFNNKIANTYSGVISDSTGSFNAKIKEFRRQFRGVKDRVFFLFRLAKIYA